MRKVGYSTGAVAKGDFLKALVLLNKLEVLDAVELSALRVEEFPAVLKHLRYGVASNFLRYWGNITLHLPNKMHPNEERVIVWNLKKLIRARPGILTSGQVTFHV